MSKYGLDFDSTICERHGIPTENDIPMEDRRPEKDSLEAINWLIKCGHEIYILTAHQSLSEVEKWLRRYGFPELRVTHEKENGTKAIVDDRAIRYEGNWQSIRKLLE